MAGRDAPTEDPNLYRKARTAAALVLVGAFVGLLFLLALRGDRMDPVLGGLILGAALLFLGISNRLVR